MRCNYLYCPLLDVKAKDYEENSTTLSATSRRSLSPFDYGAMGKDKTPELEYLRKEASDILWHQNSVPTGVCHWCGREIVRFASLSLRARRKAKHFTVTYRGRTVRLATVDHVIPVAEGGTNDLSNLVAACKACNEERGRQQPIIRESNNGRAYLRGCRSIAAITKGLSQHGPSLHRFECPVCLVILHGEQNVDYKKWKKRYYCLPCYVVSKSREEWNAS